MEFEGTFVNDNAQRLPRQVATMANSLYHSLKGEYFVGYADNMFFEKDKSAWAALVNPKNSNVNLYVNVWTVTDLSESAIRIQIWLNSVLPGDSTASRLVTPSNTTLNPLPKLRVKLLQASNVIGTPEEGVKAFERNTVSQETVVAEEDGKFIIPPGGNFAVFLSYSGSANLPASVRIAYGWWEEKICN